MDRADAAVDGCGIAASSVGAGFTDGSIRPEERERSPTPATPDVIGSKQRDQTAVGPRPAAQRPISDVDGATLMFLKCMELSAARSISHVTGLTFG
jgi:hypothetical protein